MPAILHNLLWYVLGFVSFPIALCAFMVLCLVFGEENHDPHA